ncbi:MULTISPECIES: hypothetical protein [Proteus]|jgi:hypothetical protein|uniref:hypothetical protein n=1 Tax=Proteus TaxID=583 RepID=UPI0013E9D00B|nr:MULTISPECIES: hypothetical protein [Proteus]MBG5950465.1 hypothetical protein [Proteus terrae]MCE9838328.1 hypothetical protein [Proteus terrae]MDY3693986.1 hypothetical protein [Proteus mirabilis]
MNTFIILILSLFFTNNVDEVQSQESYYAYSLTSQSDLSRCTVSPCPDPKDY